MITLIHLIEKRAAKLTREKRQECGLTQKEMARLIGVSQGYLSKIEGGHLAPSVGLWFGICKVLQMPVDSPQVAAELD